MFIRANRISVTRGNVNGLARVNDQCVRWCELLHPKFKDASKI